MTPNSCYIGDCRDGLRAIAEAGITVQTVVTSPPYWALRDYGLKPSVWGGDPECEHHWGEQIWMHKGGPHGDGVLLEGGRSVVDAQAEVKEIPAGQFCQKCGAWHGCLGLEPNPHLFIEHMVEVMALVYDLLAQDGTVWLNMGDSYASDGAGRQPTTKAGPRVPVGWTERARPERAVARGLLKPKDLCMMPHRLAIALQDWGWWVRQDIVWSKPSPMPESAKDRCTKSHEYIFLLSKSKRYYYDQDAIKEPVSPDTHARYARARSPSDYPGSQTIASSFDHMKVGPKVAGWDYEADGEGHSAIKHAKRGPKDEGRADQGLRDSTKFGRGAGWREQGVHPKAVGVTREDGKANESFSAAVKDTVSMRNKRSVWTVASEAFPDAHFATFPRKLIEPCILAGSRKGDIVLDPFLGSGTTAQVAEHLGRQWVGCEANPEYVKMQADRLRQRTLEL